LVTVQKEIRTANFNVWFEENKKNQKRKKIKTKQQVKQKQQNQKKKKPRRYQTSPT